MKPYGCAPTLLAVTGTGGPPAPAISAGDHDVDTYVELILNEIGVPQRMRKHVGRPPTSCEDASVSAGGGYLFVFVCAGCGAELTAPLSQVSLPVHARQKYGNGTQLPVLMQSGTFAVDPDPWGGPWRMWDEIEPGEAEARGIYAPVYALSDSTPGAVSSRPVMSVGPG